MEQADKRDELIQTQSEVIRTLTENNLRRMSQDFWGDGLTSPRERVENTRLPGENAGRLGEQPGGDAAGNGGKPGDTGNASGNDPKTAKGPEQAGNSALPEDAEAAQPENPPEKLEDLLAELETYVGLARVKEEVKSLINMAKIEKLREEQGLPNLDVSLHMVFSGNPGTGKTMIARFMARVYHSLGILSKGQLVEVDRSGLVAGYIGQTAIKTQKVLESAHGGVLFIDEAYALSDKGENDFGREAIDTVLKYMEDHRDDLVVIVAGYDGRMQDFIHSNPGLESRFNRFLHFEDYTLDEMLAIFAMQCKKGQYELAEGAEERLRSRLETASQNPIAFGNARGVRNLFEKTLVRQNNRLAAQETVTREDLVQIRPEDIPATE